MQLPQIDKYIFIYVVMYCMYINSYIYLHYMSMFFYNQWASSYKWVYSMLAKVHYNICITIQHSSVQGFTYKYYTS